MITDEMVEKAAKAAHAYEWETSSKPIPWEREAAKYYWRNAARAALAAVLPDIVEQCAKVADLWEQRGHAHAVVASEIRALATEASQDGKQ